MTLKSMIMKYKTTIKFWHNGNEITSVSVSPNGTYVVTYSKKDRSLEGWIVSEDDGSKWIPFERDGITLKIKGLYEISSYAVNDDKTVLCDYRYYMKALRMNERHQPIKLNPKFKPCYNISSCYFKKNGELVVFHRDRILIYSPHDKISDELILNSGYKLSSNMRGGIIENNKIWAISSNYLFQWDLETLRLECSYSLGFTTTF